ncbi:tRNA lysidine(34) synthetase TilS [Magnetofaba australis]|uniref:tRNA(Ile)-lysidine synthase n=1 Tax=Magnetofaba australis IT-1 TaxID=1434232 RepID=A0A1Y2K2B5_9PROT|nr:tRNA lysidine(34) synthetase TilS [Magnetofaba australis]OSM01746.1 putative tRNA(Ile)-lysidine synthetase [Magnetofaba australis IT-1]
MSAPPPHKRLKDPLARRIRDGLLTLLDPDQQNLKPRMIVAVSGGCDSIALLRLLHTAGLATPGNARVAHFDHALRQESNLDAKFTEECAHALGLTCMQMRWRPPKREEMGNLYDSARTARYAFLGACAREFGARYLITAHHLDDQAETFLHHLLRGAGPRGLGGMRAKRPLDSAQPPVYLLRPMLSIRRDELRQWMTEHAYAWREDPTNADERYTRARLRHQLLPAMAKLLQADPATRMSETALRVAEADSALEFSLNALWPSLQWRRDEEYGHVYAIETLRGWPPALQQRALARMQALLAPHASLSQRAFDAFHDHLSSPRKRWEMRVAGLALGRDEQRGWARAETSAPRKREENR